MSSVVAGLRVGSLISLPAENMSDSTGYAPEGNFIRNVPEELTPDVVERLIALGYTVVDHVGADAQVSAEATELQRKVDFLRERVSVAAEKGDWATYYTHEEGMRVAGNLLRDALARANAPAVA
jgi:hypothetical protein